MKASVLSIRPQYTSSTPVALFRGERYFAVLLGHLQAAGPVQYDTLLAVSPIQGGNEFCLFVSLEQGAPGQALRLGIYRPEGCQALDSVGGTLPVRANFLSFALYIVEKVLGDKLKLCPRAQQNVTVVEKPFWEFYPEADKRLKVHYLFAHRWLPAYARADADRFFGYLERGEFHPTQFIQSRFQLMEQQMRLAPPPGPDGQWLTQRRVSDLSLRVQAWPAAEANGVTAAQGGVSARRYTLAVVQMPVPETITHAWFVALAASPGATSDGAPPRTVRILTLEKCDLENQGVLCEWVCGPAGDWTHFNYATFVSVEPEAFVNAVGARLNRPAPLSHEHATPGAGIPA